MPNAARDYTLIHPRDRKAWRSWLEMNHGRSPGVWLTYFNKTSGKQCLTVDEAVEEALCFGWIDSTAKKVDEERFEQMFTPRRRGSTWSNVNKKRVEKLAEQGLMAPAGMAKIEEAKADGSWDRLNDVEDLKVPDELADALRARPGAEEGFHALSPSKRKRALWYLASAKRDETRKRRVTEIVGVAIGELSLDEMGKRKRGA